MIIISSKNQGKFEEEYLKKLIIPDGKNFFVTPEEFNNIDKTTLEESEILIYYSVGNEIIENEIFAFLRKLDKEYILVQLSDETLIAQSYEFKNAKIIFRSYFNPNKSSRNIITIPVGYQTGYFQEKEVETGRRKYIWTFFGQIYSSRKIMINKLLTLEPNYKHQSKSFMSEDILQPQDTIKIYRESIFAPCPFGYINPDTFRVMEVLEGGCIPIVSKFRSIDYYKYVFGDHPFLVINNWNEAIEKMEEYLKDDELLIKKQNEIQTWYKSFKKNLKFDIENFIFKQNYNPISSQFHYQSKAKYNLKVKFIFIYWFKIKQHVFFYKIEKLMYKIKKFLKKLVLT